MVNVKKSVEINAPIEKVFEFASEPTNLPSFWPSMIEVLNVQRRADGLHEFDWVYKMMGIRLTGHSKTIQSKKNEYVEVHNTGAIPSTFKWRYEYANGKTRLTLDVEYTIPTPVLGKFAEHIVTKLNDREAETTLANLKITMEATMQGRKDAQPHA